MAVITASQKTSESKGQDKMTKKLNKHHYKTRPITATLDHPLILDIKLLKRLDMTTFTKKGLIALSKFCGISLIKKTDAKKKLNKTLYYSKKNIDCDSKECKVVSDSNKNYRSKRKIGKQNGRAKPRIRFKIPKGDSSPDEDSSDVVCRTHKKVTTTNKKTKDGRITSTNILNDTVQNIIPEPCKTCTRSNHPERLHSHPKVLMKLASQEKKLEEKFKDALTTKDTEDGGQEQTKRNSSAKNIEESVLPNTKKSLSKENSPQPKIKSPTKSVSSTGLSSPENDSKSKSKLTRKPSTPATKSTKSKNEVTKKSSSKPETPHIEETKVSIAEEDLKFVTGCYVCGKQVSPKLRISHEKYCIAEWRTQNSTISPDKRKPEPKRPDYRFTASGDLDCEGTFESIWANHMDSLVPCKKCGRKFFPDRIERHENCCNNQPISVRNKH